ncbi:MAG TPA: hypothetical protein VJN43_02730 [Bryobacteraceae bacterium]|nr:hypothetical protein [Bryobacteraceae bacterium]
MSGEQRIARARRSLAEAQSLLTESTAEGLGACRAPLEQAAQLLARGVDELRREGGGEAAAAGIHDLRREFLRVRALHENARTLSLGWMQVLGRLAGADYSAGGQPEWPSGAVGSRVSVEG